MITSEYFASVASSVRLRRRERIVGIRLGEARRIHDALGQCIADLDSLVRERGLTIASLVTEHQAERPDIAAGKIAQHQLHLEARPSVGNLEIRLFGVDDPHVVLVGGLAVSADVRSDDGIAGHVRRRSVQSDNEQTRRLRDELIDQLLPIALHGQLRVGGQREAGSEQQVDGAEHQKVSPSGLLNICVA